MEIWQLCKKVCSGDRGLSLHMYHNKECFQKLTNMTKQFQKYALVHSQMHNSSNNQEYLRQDKKVNLNSDSKQNMGNIDFFQHNNFNCILVFKQTINYHQYLNPFFSIKKLNSTTESTTPSK